MNGSYICSIALAFFLGAVFAMSIMGTHTEFKFEHIEKAATR